MLANQKLEKLTYDCAAPASTPFDQSIGSMASAAGAPPVCSIRTIKSDVVVGLGPNGDDTAAKLDQSEDGWKISGKYVSRRICVGAKLSLTHASVGCHLIVSRSAWREGPLCLNDH